MNELYAELTTHDMKLTAYGYRQIGYIMRGNFNDIIFRIRREWKDIIRTEYERRRIRIFGGHLPYTPTLVLEKTGVSYIEFRFSMALTKELIILDECDPSNSRIPSVFYHFTYKEDFSRVRIADCVSYTTGTVGSVLEKIPLENSYKLVEITEDVRKLNVEARTPSKDSDAFEKISNLQEQVEKLTELVYLLEEHMILARPFPGFQGMIEALPTLTKAPATVQLNNRVKGGTENE